MAAAPTKQIIRVKTRTYPKALRSRVFPSTRMPRFTEPTTLTTRMLLINPRDLSSLMLAKIRKIRNAGMNREIIVRTFFFRNNHLSGVIANLIIKSIMKIIQIMLTIYRNTGVSCHASSITRSSSHENPRIIRGSSVIRLIFTSCRYRFLLVEFFTSEHNNSGCFQITKSQD